MRLPKYDDLDLTKTPRYKRILKHYDDFILCVNMGDAGFIGSGHPSLNHTLYLYTIKGKSITHHITKGDGEYGTPFNYEYTIHDSPEGKLIDIKKYLYSYGLFEGLEDFYYIGFNTLDKNVDWDGRLISKEESSITIDKPNSHLVCLDGDVTINDKEFKRFDCASVDVDKEYRINHTENSALGLFTKLN